MYASKFVKRLSTQIEFVVGRFRGVCQPRNPITRYLTRRLPKCKLSFRPHNRFQTLQRTNQCYFNDKKKNESNKNGKTKPHLRWNTSCEPLRKTLTNLSRQLSCDRNCCNLWIIGLKILYKQPSFKSLDLAVWISSVLKINYSYSLAFRIRFFFFFWRIRVIS